MTPQEQYKKGNEIRTASRLIRDHRDWEACTSPQFTPGSYEEKVYVHNRKYPQHPLCVRRVYWRVEAEADERDDGERFIRLYFDRLEPSLSTRMRLYEVEVEHTDYGLEMVKSTGLLVEGAYDIFDPVDQVFGQEGLLEEVRQVGGGREALLIQEQLLKDAPEDWGELYHTHFGAREVIRPDGSEVMEVVQILRLDDEEREYHPIPRYPQY